MRIRTGKPKDKKEYLNTQKEAFPSIDIKDIPNSLMKKSKIKKFLLKN